MQTRNLIRLIFASLVLGLGLGTVQPAMGQFTNVGALFQYAIFYNGLMEFTDCSPLTNNGPVQCNSNIYVGCPSSSSTLTFNSLVTCSGIITNPSWFGYPQNSYIPNSITYNGTPVTGLRHRTAAVIMPIGLSAIRPALSGHYQPAERQRFTHQPAQFATVLLQGRSGHFGDEHHHLYYRDHHNQRRH